MDFNNSHSRRNFVRQLSAVGAAALSTESIRHGAETADTLSNERQVDTPRFVHPTLTRHARGWLRLSGSKQSSNSPTQSDDRPAGVTTPTGIAMSAISNSPHHPSLNARSGDQNFFVVQDTYVVAVAGNQNNADQ